MGAGCAITRVFAALEERGIEAVVPAKAEPPPKKGTVPVGRFMLDAKDRVVRCPGGKLLRPHGKPDGNGFQRKRARVPDCRSCRLRPIRFSPAMKRQAILLHKDDPALLRARRKCARWVDTSARCTAATALAWRASSARRKPSTACPAPSDAASLTCGSRPASLPRSISNGWRLSSCACCS